MSTAGEAKAGTARRRPIAVGRYDVASFVGVVAEAVA
jgi:hypothetical protein